MMKKNKWKLLITSLVILFPILFGLIVWDKLPEQMTTHWGMDGNADGWSSREFAVFALPLFMLAGHWICIFCTSKDPKNKEQNSKVFGRVLWICPVVSLILGGMIYAAALGKEFKMNTIMSLLIGLMFVVIGNYLPKCRQNHTIGIKVKWTLENEENWNATHRFGGKVWVASGILLMAGSFLPENIVFYFLLSCVIVSGILPVGYSFCYYRMQQGR